MNATDAQRAWLTLILAHGVGPAIGMRLLQAHGDADAALAAGPQAWLAAGVPRALHDSLRHPDEEALARCTDWLAQPGCRLVPLDAPQYPQALIETGRPPLALFCLGDSDLLRRDQFAVVGARAASPQGLEDARALADGLTRAGLCITSGMASGIDGAAHEGALDAGGHTIAVLGTGPDRVYPARHRRLAHRIAETGLLVTEYPPGTTPEPHHFPQRNRIIAGLSLGVLVVEAAARSGSLITARLAAEFGREVFALPGSIHHTLARGCHALIRDGAVLVEDVHDVLRALGRGAPSPARVDTLAADAGIKAPSKTAARILQAFGHADIGFDQLVTRTGLDVQRLSSGLLELELCGLVVSRPGGTFMRITRNPEPSTT